jgi:anti-sigma factor RsiW
MKTPTPPVDDDLHAWEAQREAMRQLHREVLDEPVPPALLAAAGLAARQHARQNRWMRWGGMAAGIAFAFAAGWLAKNQW